MGSRLLSMRWMLMQATSHATGKPWYDRALDSMPRIAEIFTALLGAIALAGFVRGLYRRTLGRRRDWYARLSRLGTNASLAFFSSVLGQPAMERTFVSNVTRYDDSGAPSPVPTTFKEAVWIDRDFYVHALADAVDETVHAYSVTTRSKRFHPTFRSPGGYGREPNWLWRLFGKEYRFEANPAVKLGKTRFAGLGRPQQAAAWIGAHNWHYFEPYYFGNPGNYQYFVYSVNDAGVGTPPFPSSWIGGGFSWGFAEGTLEAIDPKLALVQTTIAADLAEAEGQSLSGEELEVEDEQDVEELAFEPEEDPSLPMGLVGFRQRARINTYTVIGPELALDDYPLSEGRLDQYPVTFGVTNNRVRTLG